MAECYVRGNTIKYICVPDDVLDKVQEEIRARPQTSGRGGRGRGRGEGGRGRGEGGRGRGRGRGNAGD